nr:retrovirus-related Pol polyprotein from transposon TNT 1-94 [Tanacetum cinerariifolium]
MDFVSSTNNNSTNGTFHTAQAVNTAIRVFTVDSQVNTANIDNLSDAIIYAFLASQPNGHVDNEGQKFLKENRNEADCQWECRALRSQDTKHKESTRRIVPMETPASTALVSCDGIGGYDWSDQAKKGPNYALMAYTSTSLDSKIVDNCKKGLGYENYNDVPPPYTGNFMPQKPDLSFTGLDEFTNKPVVENCDAKTSETKPKDVRKNTDALIIKECVLDDEDEETIQPKFIQKTVKPNFEKIDSLFQQTSSLKPYVPNVILEKIIIDLEDEVVNLLEKEKVNLETIESLKSKGFESSENVSSESENQSENDCLVVEKECDKEENPTVIAPDLDTFSSVRRPKNSGVIWKKKGSSNTSNVHLSAVSVSNLNKNVKRYSRKYLLACNNSHLGETSSASVCNDAMNVSCNSRMNDLHDDNNFFIFDDVNVRISLVSKMPFRKKLRDSMHIVQICLWIINLGCSKHMTGNRALLMNFVKKFLGTVRFGNNDFVVIAGYGDVVIGSMTIKKVFYVKCLRHNLFSAGQFCDKGLEVAFQKSTCFVRNEDGVDLLTSDRLSNLYTISLNEVASNSSTYLLAKASSQSWLWRQRLSHLNFATINNLVKNNRVLGLPKMKFEKYHPCSAREQGKIHQKHHKSKTAFASNKPLYLLYIDLCGPMRIQSINGKRYVLVVVDDYSRYTWVFFLHSKDEASKVIISFIKKTQVNLQLQVQRVRTDNGTEFKNKTLAKFFDKVGITYNTPKLGRRGISGPRRESSSSSLNDDVQQCSEEVGVPSSTTQSISNNMIPNDVEASTSHNVFNEHLEDAYFDASTSFHDSSNVHTFYQPYPHEKKWTKDHPLHKIIGDPKSSVRTRGQLANLCLFSCLLSSIEPANVAEALRDADWVSAMQEELDQFVRLKV